MRMYIPNGRQFIIANSKMRVKLMNLTPNFNYFFNFAAR